MKIIFSTTFLFLVSIYSFCCECNGDITEFTIKDYISYSIIFDGKLDTSYVRDKYTIYSFSVSKCYKGDQEKIIDVVLFNVSGMCSYTGFVIGKNYRVFGNKIEAFFYFASMCGHTHELNSGNVHYKKFSSDSLSVFVNGAYRSMTAKEFNVYSKKIMHREDSLLNYLSTTRSGPVISYFLNGKVSAKGTFTNNKPSGLWTFYYPDGKINETGTFNEYGFKDGYWEEYLSPSAYFPIRKGYYNVGKLCGVWKWYDKDGKFLEDREMDDKCK